mgnify:CR=1 FL=1
MHALCCLLLLLRLSTPTATGTCGEEDDVISQVGPGGMDEVADVVLVIATEAVLVLYLQEKRRGQAAARGSLSGSAAVQRASALCPGPSMHSNRGKLRTCGKSASQPSRVLNS